MNDRQRLEAIVSVVCKYLPPDGICIEQAMNEIISLVDPLPPQRSEASKQLTDEWIADAVKEAGETSVPNTDIECFAWLVRKVEAAHGIKE